MKTKTVTHIEVDTRDLEELIDKVYEVKKDEYGHGFSAEASEEWNGDLIYEFTVEPEARKDYDRAKWDELSAGRNPMYFVGRILNDLCLRGELAAGEYLIQN